MGKMGAAIREREGKYSFATIKRAQLATRALAASKLAPPRGFADKAKDRRLFG